MLDFFGVNSFTVQMFLESLFNSCAGLKKKFFFISLAGSQKKENSILHRTVRFSSLFFPHPQPATGLLGLKMP